MKYLKRYLTNNGDYDEWEEVHGHDIRLKCYPEFGCQLLVDPEDIRQLVERVTGLTTDKKQK